MDTDSFNIHITTGGVYEDGLTHETILKIIKKPLPREMNKKVIGIFKSELAEKVRK